MTIPSSTIIIIVVIVFAFYLIYSQNNQRYTSDSQVSSFAQMVQNAQSNNNQPGSCPKCDHYRHLIAATRNQPQTTHINIENDNDPYSDPIKKQDAYSMQDPLTYPQMRLPREVLNKYNEYYEKHGMYPPFNQATQPLFDNPILNGYLVKVTDQNEPFADNVPSPIPLFRVKSAKNADRYFYYILDQRYLSKVELKITLDSVKVNGVRRNNSDFYGLPELFDGDIIENISIYPNNKFKVVLYKQYHFP